MLRLLGRLKGLSKACEPDSGSLVLRTLADSTHTVAGLQAFKSHCHQFSSAHCKKALAATKQLTGSGYTRSHSTYAGFAHSAAHSSGGSVAASSVAHGLDPATRRAVAWWLGGCSAWVASLVVLGGMTRLTRSGLSMTEWKFTGEAPPSSQAEWEAEFDKYKASPEFKAVNQGMSLGEFKFIYWMEWAHRMWGRALGFVFLLPAAYFVARGQVKGSLAQRLALLGAMGGTQGLVGWWMVRSGLQVPGSEHSTPRVSPYRLAAHLASAFTIYAVLVWTTLSLAFPAGPVPAVQLSPAAARAVAGLRSKAHPLAALIGLTALSGAFVAGNDAGHAYNDFPLMNGQWVPDEYFSVPGWRNVFESTAAVQLHHRVLALTTLLSVGAVWWSHRGLNARHLPRGPRMLLNGLLSVTCLQVALGIATLWSYVRPELGASHQASALALFTIALALLHSVQSTSYKPTAMSRMLGPAAAVAVAGVAVAVSSLQ